MGERPDPETAAGALAAALEPLPEAPPLRLAAPLWLAPRRPHVLTVALEDPTGGLAEIQVEREMDHALRLGLVTIRQMVEAYAYNREAPLLFARGGYGRFTQA